MADAKPLEKRRGHSLLIIRLIAVDKFFKSASLLFIGGVILHSMNLDKSVHDILRDFINALRIDEHNAIIHELLQRSLGVSDHVLPWLTAGTLFYSVLYFVEGIGLFFDKAWAEWLTVVSTAALIPVEIFEIFHHPTMLRLVIFVINVLILVYVCMRLHWRHLAKKHARAHGATLIIPRETLRTGIKP